MGRRKIQDRNVRKLSRGGNGSMYVTLPIEMVRALRWRERQKVVISRKGKTLTITDWRP